MARDSVLTSKGLYKDLKLTSGNKTISGDAKHSPPETGDVLFSLSVLQVLGLNPPLSEMLGQT